MSASDHGRRTSSRHESAARGTVRARPMEMADFRVALTLCSVNSRRLLGRSKPIAAHVGHAGLPPVAGSVDLEWSDDALADLERFAAFLHERSPELAAIVAQEIVARAQVLSRHPKLGRPLSTREEYRQIVLEVL